MGGKKVPLLVLLLYLTNTTNTAADKLLSD